MSRPSKADRKIKVLLLIPNISAGGAERVFLTIARRLDRSQFEPAIGLLQRVGTEYQDDLPADVPLIVLGVDRVRFSVFKILSLIRSHKPDLVFCTTNEMNLVMGLVAWLRRGKETYVAREPNIPSVHNRALPNTWLRVAISKRMYRYFDRIVCQTSAIRDDFINEWAIPASKLEVIHNPVDIERIRKLAAQAVDLSYLPADAISVMAGGRLDTAKDFALMLEAIAICEEPRVHLSILGTGPLEAQLKVRATELGIDKRVHFLGFQANPFAYFKHAQALLLSSHYEGMPNIALEALACGTPVIAFSKVNGLDDLVAICQGIELVPQRNAKSLAQAIAKLGLEKTKRAASVSILESLAVTRRYAQMFAKFS